MALSIYRETFNTVYQKIRETFPFKNQKEYLQFQRLTEKFRDKIKAQYDPEYDFFLFLRNYLAQLHNSHIQLGQHPSPPRYKPKGYSVLYLQEQYYLLKDQRGIAKILFIDGSPPKKILRYWEQYVSASTPQSRRQQAIKHLLSSFQAKSVNLVLTINNQERKMRLKRQVIQFQSWKEVVISKVILRDIGYLKIRTWSNQYLTEKMLMDTFFALSKQKLKGMIIDLRGNNGGNSRIAKSLASHFFPQRVFFGSMKVRLHKNSLKCKRFYAYVEPAQPLFEKPIILLVDSHCASTSEYFIIGLKDNKRAIVMGETTGGGCNGNPKKFSLPYGDSSFELLVSTWLFYRPNGKPIEAHGIRPHIIVKPTFSGLKEKKDEVLIKAIHQMRVLITGKTDEHRLRKRKH